MNQVSAVDRLYDEPLLLRRLSPAIPLDNNIFNDKGFSATLTLLSADQVQGGAVLP